MKGSRKIKLGLFVVVVCLLIATVSFGVIIFDKKTDIDKILEGDSYSYLPVEAKEYLKGLYEKTGEVLLTEKNKEENTPYLNPEYVEYLVLSEDEQEKVDVIPNIFVIDYSVEETIIDELPETYNLNNVNEKNYLTPFNDQGSLGLCWAFASLQQAESYLMVSNKQSYSNTTDRFSVRQIDYATSNNGINNYENENGFRPLTSGGNFYMSSLIMSYGLTMADDSLMIYDSSVEKKELVNVLNFKNSKYELNSSIMMPTLSVTSSQEEKESYNDVIKENIIKYGGAYVGTVSPTENCGFKNIDGTYAMVDADDCVGSTAHAMQIIGWDDNYKYSYCSYGSYHLDVNENGSCDKGTLVSETGAWILRNSWGEKSEYKYVYLGYSSYGLDISFTTSLSKMSERSWDNVYHKNIWTDGTADTTKDSIVFVKKINTAEKVEKVKFMSAGMNGSYTISVETENNKYVDIETVNVNYPGIYTIDLSSKNILLDSSEFKVIVKSNNETKILANTISIFTSNINKTPMIKTENLDGNSVKVNSESNYEFLVYSDTKNIDSNYTINYSLFNGTTDYSNYIVSVNNNKVAENNVNANIMLSKDIPVGKYTLKTFYNDYEFESTILIPSIYALEGEGTEKNPYLLYSEEDLEQIRYDLDAYYLLKNDIVLTKEWVPIGTYNKPFRGGFDGGNYIISGLTISEERESSVGFFGYVDAKYAYEMQTPIDVYYQEKTYIKNVTFKDAVVSSKGNASVLIGQLIFDPTNAPETAFNVMAPSLTIDSVHFVGGSVTSLTGDAGVVIGNLNIIPMSWRKPYLEINNLFSSVTISGFHSAGLIGYVNDSYESGSGIMLDLQMSNFQNVGILKQSIFESVNTYKSVDNYSPVVGGLYGNAKFSLSNYIINSIFDDVNYTGEFFYRNKYFFLGSFDPKTSENLSYKLNNGYYVSKYGSSRNDGIVTADEINDETLYEKWEDFSVYWKIETVDDIVRLPVLKDIDYNYTNVSDIDLKLYDKVSLLDYIEGNSEFQYVSFEVISNDKVVDFDYTFTDKNMSQSYYDNIEIIALTKGKAVVRIINQYDGLEKEININVTADKVEKPCITYYISDEDGEENYTQMLNALETFKLTKNQFHRLGYKFMGWNTIADGTGTSYFDESLFEDGIDEDLRLYAQWQKIQYTINFNANGGTGIMNDNSGYINNSILLSGNTFAREGYKFTGWNTKADGTGISYANRATLKLDEILISSIDGEIITLYAQWAKEGKITFNSNDDNNKINEQKITLKQDVKLSKNIFVRNGYIFKEWNTESDGTGISYTDEQTINIDEDLTLYAIWEESYSFVVNKYSYDEVNKYIDLIDINTSVEDFKKNFVLNDSYSIDVEYKIINDKQLLYTGSKTKIYKNQNLYVELTNIIRGEVSGDGRINYSDYVKVYNHIQKTKYPELNKTLLKDEYLLAADMKSDGKINYSDYVRIYNKIKELKGGN